MEDRTHPASVRNLSLAAILLALSGLAIFLPSGARPLSPALVALTMVFATRQATLSLLTACLSGLILLIAHPDHPSPGTLARWLEPATGGLRQAILGPWHFGALLFTLLLGAFAAVVEKSNGLLPLLRAGGEPTGQNRRRFLTSVFGLGLLCFFDGLANALMLGRVARPAADRLRVSRAFLAYLVDTTSSAVACLAFLSTWIVTQLSFIEQYSPIDRPAYLQFLDSIPRNYYCLFALLLAFLAIRRNWLIGPMRHARATPLELTDQTGDPIEGRLRSALVPLAILLLSIPTLILLLFQPEPGHPPADLGERVRLALDASTVPTAFVLGSALAVLGALACFPRDRFRAAPPAALHGARQLLPALLILVLAWILGSLLSALGTANVLSRTLGEGLPLAWFPAGVFLLGCAISFVSGTSWGTMGILMPIALPTAGKMAITQGVAPDQLALLVPAVIAAVFGGAVFGDHCSPYSDTTIVSALASGVGTPEHTITQLPYALLAAAVAVGAGYVPLALGLSPWLALLLGSGALAALVLLVRPKPS